MDLNAKVVIVHGTYSDPSANWFPWLKRNLLDCGMASFVPRFPTPEGQSLNSWKDTFSREVGPLESNLILVGHSLGAAFILNLLQDASVAVKAAVLVAGFIGRLDLPDYDPLNESFCVRSFDWEKIRNNAKIFAVISSDNDPYVPLAKGQELALNLKSPLILIDGAGHINAESGYTEFAFVLETIRRMAI